MVDVRLRSSPHDPNPANGIALVDTGATSSFIDRDTAERGGYAYSYRSDLSILSRGNEEEGVDLFSCYLEIVGLGAFLEPVNMAPIYGETMPEHSPERPFVAIIGQDLLRLFVFVQDGPKDSFSLATPSIEPPS